MSPIKPLFIQKYDDAAFSLEGHDLKQKRAILDIWMSLRPLIQNYTLYSIMDDQVITLGLREVHYFLTKLPQGIPPAFTSLVQAWNARYTAESFEPRIVDLKKLIIAYESCSQKELSLPRKLLRRSLAEQIVSLFNSLNHAKSWIDAKSSLRAHFNELEGRVQKIEAKLAAPSPSFSPVACSPLEKRPSTEQKALLSSLLAASW